jgi:hypothetical protein
VYDCERDVSPAVRNAAKARLASAKPHSKQFVDFVERFGKRALYCGPDPANFPCEESYRREIILLRNVRHIEAHNAARPKGGMRKVVTRFADLSADEFAANHATYAASPTTAKGGGQRRLERRPSGVGGGGPGGPRRRASAVAGARRGAHRAPRERQAGRRERRRRERRERRERRRRDERRGGAGGARGGGDRLGFGFGFGFGGASRGFVVSARRRVGARRGVVDAGEARSVQDAQPVRDGRRRRG